MAGAPGSLALLPMALLALLSSAVAHPSRVMPRFASTPLLRPNFVGEGTNELATLILQGYVDSDQNMAFSPLGYSALLAILAEGAGGETRRQLEAALHLPEERAATRDAYHAVLERLREKNVVNKPELRTWFYVYKNHSVDPAYRDVLREYYLTDVKSVSRPAVDMGFQKLGDDDEAEGEAGAEPAPAPEPTPAPAMESDSDPQPPGAALEEAMTLGAMKEGALIETALQEEKTRLAAEKLKIQDTKEKEEEESKKQETAQEGIMNLEEPAKEIEKEMQNPMSEKLKDETKKDEAMKETKPMSEEKPMDEMKQDQQKEEPAPEAIPMKEEEESEPAPQEEGEMMMTSERRKQRQQKPILTKEEKAALEAAAEAAGELKEVELERLEKLKAKKPTTEVESGAAKKPATGTEAEAGAAAGAGAPLDGLSGLSGNALVGKTPEGTTARMLLFNGLYFRGSWRTPFAPLEEREAFYLSPERKASVPMMRARGAFRVGNIPELDSVAVELPYEGDRYSLLFLLPNAPGGLRSLVADLAGYSLRNLYDSMESREVDVTLPCFAIETITRPIAVFAKFGVSDVFDKQKADLSGVSAAKGLYVQDLVQLVTVRVDNSSSAISHLTSSALESRTGNFDKIVADKPFLYFVRDTVDNLIVVAGKVMNPEDPPVPYS